MQFEQKEKLGCIDVVLEEFVDPGARNVGKYCEIE